ncbi:MAG: hypothetical protein KC516_04155 [Nanoarchaeota archaeon]|nr:hypothetical protein [Nanoarchaeota archaeon]
MGFSVSPLDENYLLGERSFELGVCASESPPEPEPLIREYYNLGLKLFHAHKNIHYHSRGIGLANFGKDSFWKDESSFKSFKSSVEISGLILLKMDEEYFKYLQFKEDFQVKNPNLIKILEEHIDFDNSYDVCRNSVVYKVIEKKRKFNEAYGNLFKTLYEVGVKKY